MRSRTHILMTTDTVGGVWVYATTLAAGLARSGMHVTLVTMGPPPQRAQQDAIAALPEGVKLVVTDLALEWLDPEGQDTARAHAELLRITERMSPDIVHLNGFRQGAIGWPCPSVVVAHSCVLSWWAACKAGGTPEPRWSRYGDAVAAGLAGADEWIAPTAAFRDVVLATYRPGSTGRVIYNGVDAGPPPTAKRNASILAAGRVWDEAKNLNALSAIASDLPWPVHVAGSGVLPTDDQASTEDVLWLGEVPHAELRQRMREAAIYVAPAVYEPFGLGILEAAAAGCALVLSDIPTLRELWDGAAMFVQPHDSVSLRDVLLRLCADAPERRRLQRAARARARQYSLERTISEYQMLYRGLLRRRGSTSGVSQVEAHA
jgi:glycosyltransferase involved in cell wall biosynthesis